jgi:hypothetical protein
MLSDEQFAALQEQNRAAHEKQQETLRTLAESLLAMEKRVGDAEARHAAEDAEEKALRKSTERQRMWRSAVLAVLHSGALPKDSTSEATEAAAIARFADAIVAEDDKRVP